jgi:hypothetical protein
MTKITTCVAALVATAGIGAPSALAVGPQPHGQPDVQSTATSTGATNHPLLGPQPSRVARVSDRAGFDWSAAAIGALAAAGGSLVLIGLVRDIRRRHEPKAV